MACAAADSSDDAGKHGVSSPISCPICLTAYKTPRMLFCLHSFCEGCLQDLAKKTAEKGSPAVECPVCLVSTAAPDPPKSVEEWAKQLPLNHGIQSILRAEDLENDSRPSQVLYCGSCAKVKKSEIAISFCVNCGQYQCATCVEVHSKFSAMENHTIVSQEEAATARSVTVNLGTAARCQEHTDKELEFYCDTHKALCCSSCAIVEHRMCDGIADLKTLGGDEQMEDKSKQLNNKMETLQSQLGVVNTVCETNVSSIESQVEALVQNVKAVHEQVLQKLDDLVLQVSSQCEKLKGEHSVTMMTSISRNKRLIAAMHSSRILLESVKKDGSERQIFIVSHEVERHTQLYEKSVQKAGDDVSTVELHLDMDPAVDALVKIGSSLAKVKVTRSNVELENQSDFEALTPISECAFEKILLAEIGQQTKSCYRGAGFLPDGRLVTVDGVNNLCCLLDGTYNVTASAKLPSKPGRMAVIGQTEVAVALPDSSEIQVVSIATDKAAVTLARRIPCTGKPLCVARAGDTELVLGLEEGLSFVSLDGQESRYVQTNAKCNDIAVDRSRARVYLACAATSAVYGYGLEGQLQFTYREPAKLKSPCGLSLDREGNIYVCDNTYSGKVYQLSPAGKLISTLDPKFTFPYTLCFTCAGDQMLVMNGPSVTNSLLRVDFRAPL